MVDSFQGTYAQQIRIVGATEKPASLPYRANMTLLDAMIQVGGLSQYAAGNRARLIRHDRATGKQKEYDLKIARLLKQRRHQRQRPARAGRRHHHPREHVLTPAAGAARAPFQRTRAPMDGLYEQARIALHQVWRRRWLALGVAWGLCLRRLAGRRPHPQQL